MRKRKAETFTLNHKKTKSIIKLFCPRSNTHFVASLKHPSQYQQSETFLPWCYERFERFSKKKTGKRKAETFRAKQITTKSLIKLFAHVQVLLLWSQSKTLHSTNNLRKFGIGAMTGFEDFAKRTRASVKWRHLG